MKDKLKETLTDMLAYLLKCERRTLLWTNPSPSAAFGAQNIYLDLSGYDAVKIDVSMYRSNTGVYHETYYGEIGTNLIFSGILYASSWLLGRECEITNSYIAFNQAYVNTGVNNEAVIPYKIYGIKVGGGTP